MTTEEPTQDESVPGREPSVDPAGSVRLLRLTINQFRHVVPGTTLEFDDGLNIFLGRNGSGKTTILELIVNLLKGDLRPYQRESFDLRWTARLGKIQFDIQIEHQRERPSNPLFRDSFVEEVNTSSSWKYEILAKSSYNESRVIGTTNGVRVLRDGEESSSIGDASPFRTGFFISHFFQSTKELGDETEEWLDALLVMVRLWGEIWRLDEGLDLFRCLLDGSQLDRHSESIAGINVTGDHVSGTYVPEAVWRSLMSRKGSAHAFTEVSFEAEDIGFLEVFSELIRKARVSLTLRLRDREPKSSDREMRSTYGGPVFRMTTPEGAIFSHDDLSYGEKRLLAFLWHAAVNPEILVVDELVNGLHHEWIQKCLDAIQGQAFLTSQNPLLLDHLWFESADEVRCRFVLCDRDDDGNWIWRNMSEEMAGSFYRAYEVGIQHVSEILRTKGLW